MPACEAPPAAHGFAVAAQGLAAETLAAHGLAVFCAHGLADMLWVFDLGAQGFDVAQGFTAAAEVFPRIREASWSEGPSRVMAKSHGSNEKIAPLNQCGPGSHEKKSAA